MGPAKNYCVAEAKPHLRNWNNEKEHFVPVYSVFPAIFNLLYFIIYCDYAVSVTVFSAR